MSVLGLVVSALSFWLFGYLTGSSINRGIIATMRELPAGTYELVSLPVFHQGSGYVAVCRHENTTLYSVCHHDGLPQRWRRKYSLLRGYYPLPLEEVTPRKRTVVPS